MLQSINDPITAFTRKEQDPYFLKGLSTHSFVGLQQSYASWIRLLNFEPSTQKYAPVKTTEFLCWVEQQGITQIASITRDTITGYFEYLVHRPKRRQGGRLSKNSLRSHLTNLRRLSRYLRESGQESFGVDYKITGKGSNKREVFTKDEIAALYEVITSDVLGLRDRAMLAVYYGCGLRRNEGLMLEQSDILWDRNLLYVRRGKNHKERYVPMTATVGEDIKTYLECARPLLLKQTNQYAFFLGRSGHRIIGSTMIERLHQLKERAGIQKDAGLHSLRHSIATHLLQSGMELEKIKQFLGHSSLESTQIYTHLCHESE